MRIEQTLAIWSLCIISMGKTCVQNLENAVQNVQNAEYQFCYTEPWPRARSIRVGFKSLQRVRYTELRRQCQMPSFENLITYHRLRWLGKVYRMSHDRLLVRTLFGRISGHGPRGRPHKTWIEFTRDDLTRLSELQGVRGHTSTGGYSAKIGKSGQ